MAHDPRVEEFLRHYASATYDPVKAREYYLRNRQLKGRSSGVRGVVRGLSPSRAPSTQPRSVGFTSGREAQLAQIELLRSRAKARSDTINAKLVRLKAAQGKVDPDELRKLGNDLKSALAVSRENYKTALESLKNKATTRPASDERKENLQNGSN